MVWMKSFLIFMWSMRYISMKYIKYENMFKLAVFQKSELIRWLTHKSYFTRKSASSEMLPPLYSRMALSGTLLIGVKEEVLLLLNGLLVIRL